MSHIKLLSSSVLGVFLLLPTQPALAASESSEIEEKRVRTYVVRCDRGERIGRILNRPAEELVIHVRGICKEDVTIERNMVTLIGRDPELDGIVGDNAPNTVVLRGVFGIHIENLTLVGAVGETVLGATDTFRVEVVGSILRGIEGAAVFAGAGATLLITDTVLSSTGANVLSVFGGTVTGNGLRLTNDGEGRAVTVARSGFARFNGSSLEGRIGLRVISQAGAVTVASEVVSTPVEGVGHAVELDFGATATFIDTSFVGPFSIDNKSLVELRDVTQTIGPDFASGNRVRFDSLLRINGNTGLERDVHVETFSNAGFAGTTTVVGSLVCDSTSDAVCSEGFIAAMSSCGQCPLP